ncbi:hypothetical protein NUSPORA_00409 [Nucleospora cyclopteri]
MQYINNQNYYKLFKTEKYWRNKADILFQKTKLRALNEFNITESTFTAEHLYNLLLLIPLKNSKNVAYTCYIYHVMHIHEININLKNVTNEKYDLIIQSRKKIFAIQNQYKKHMDNARHVFNRRCKKMEN